MHPVPDTLVRHTVADQVAPLVQLYAQLEARWPLTVNVAAAAARVHSGRPAYDAAGVIGAAGSLLVPYVRATVALERAGLASDEEAIDARERRLHVRSLLGAWLAGEPTPRDRVRATAVRAAGIVAGSILRRASAAVRATGALAGWARASCPCCGGAPDFSVRAGGERTLVCARCDESWRTTARGCLGCGAREAPTIARIASESLGYELAICNACGRYLKEPTEGELRDPLVERVLTAQLDAAAEARGLRL